MESIIRSPAAGTILTRAVNPGDPVVPLTSYQPGTELAAIADMSDLIFKGTVDEIDVGKLHTGMTARIKVGALPTDVVTGKVSRIAPQAQQKEGATLFDVEIELEPTSNIVLRAGYSANADLIIREVKDVPTLPERVVIFEDGGKKTFVELPGATPKEAPKKVAVNLGRAEHAGRGRPGRRREGHRAAAQEAHLGRRLTPKAAPPCSPFATPSGRCGATCAARSCARS
jgi:HlyD family secretion protein